MVDWDIRREGRAWGEEAMSRFEMAPWKTEMVGGKIFVSDEERLAVLGLLLENMGTDAAVRFGDVAVWRASLDALDGGG